MSGCEHPDCGYHKSYLGAFEKMAQSAASKEYTRIAARRADVGFLTGRSYLTSLSRMTRDRNSGQHVETWKHRETGRERETERDRES